MKSGTGRDGISSPECFRLASRCNTLMLGGEGHGDAGGVVSMATVEGRWMKNEGRNK